MNIGYLSEPKSKLGLPRFTTGLDKSLNQSPQGGLEKIDYTSSNGPPRNCCKVPDKYLIGHVLGEQNGGSTPIFEFIRSFADFLTTWFFFWYLWVITLEHTAFLGSSYLMLISWSFDPFTDPYELSIRASSQLLFLLSHLGIQSHFPQLGVQSHFFQF